MILEGSTWAFDNPEAPKTRTEYLWVLGSADLGCNQVDVFFCLRLKVCIHMYIYIHICIYVYVYESSKSGALSNTLGL